MSQSDLDLVKRIHANFSDGRSSFEDFQADLLDLSEHRDWEVSSMLLRGRMRDSTAEVRLEETYARRLVDDKVVEVREYRTREQAIAWIAVA